METEVHKNKPLTPSALLEMLEELRKEIAASSERSRLLEERLKQVREKIQIIDETYLKKIEDIKGSIKENTNEIQAFRKDLDEIKEIIRRITKEMSQMAKLNDVKLLEKYVDMLDVTRIVTREEVIKLINDEMLKFKNKK